MVNTKAPIAVLLIAISVSTATAFTQPRTTCVDSTRSSTANIGNDNACSVLRTIGVSYRSPTSLSASTSNIFSPLSWFAPKEKENNNDKAILDVKSQIASTIADTDLGRSANPDERTQITSLLSELESLCPLSAPARDPRMGGPWIVLYTDAPSPSNGQLLLWKGIAKQVIDLAGGRYRNELYVGGSGNDRDEDAWLTAVLDADWKEWDGVYLDDSSSTSEGAAGFAEKQQTKDFGATTWEVTFESITLSVFQIPIFTQQFKAGTSRTWKMTYLDDDTRIVRAGKTGREEDDWIFYMRRGNQ